MKRQEKGLEREKIRSSRLSSRTAIRISGIRMVNIHIRLLFYFQQHIKFLKEQPTTAMQMKETTQKLQ